MADLEFFEPALDQLKAALPSWWAQERLDSELAILCQVVAEFVDELAASIEAIYLDQSIATASDEALRSEWAPLYGVSREDLPLDTETLRAYLQARAGEDGSIASLERTLAAILANPLNTTGTTLTFPSGGGGLTFPANGSGLGPLYAATSDSTPELQFPPGGGGLTFPANGSGLQFPTGARFQVIEDFADYQINVSVLTYLAFDRAAFARAVGRFRQAHMLPPTITETET